MDRRAARVKSCWLETAGGRAAGLCCSALSNHDDTHQHPPDKQTHTPQSFPISALTHTSSRSTPNQAAPWRSRGFLSDSLHLLLLLILLSCLFLKQKLRNGATDLQGWRCLYNVIKNSHITCPYYSLNNTWEVSERERWEGRKSRFALCKTTNLSSAFSFPSWTSHRPLLLQQEIIPFPHD